MCHQLPFNNLMFGNNCYQVCMLIWLGLRTDIAISFLRDYVAPSVAELIGEVKAKRNEAFMSALVQNSAKWHHALEAGATNLFYPWPADMKPSDSIRAHVATISTREIPVSKKVAFNALLHLRTNGISILKFRVVLSLVI